MPHFHHRHYQQHSLHKYTHGSHVLFEPRVCWKKLWKRYFFFQQWGRRNEHSKKPKKENQKKTPHKTDFEPNALYAYMYAASLTTEYMYEYMYIREQASIFSHYKWRQFFMTSGNGGKAYIWFSFKLFFFYSSFITFPSCSTLWQLCTKKNIENKIKNNNNDFPIFPAYRYVHNAQFHYTSKSISNQLWMWVFKKRLFKKKKEHK